MNVFFYIYISAWGSACIFSLILYLRDKNSYAFSHANYWRFLLIPWKVVTFVIATTALTVIAPYTGDPTWDYFDALFMSLLTFSTAPWAIGIIYKVTKKELPLKRAFVAVCIWMFSASWSYDLYLLIRDGYYPATWLPNIFCVIGTLRLGRLVLEFGLEKGKRSDFFVYGEGLADSVIPFCFPQNPLVCPAINDFGDFLDFTFFLFY